MVPIIFLNAPVPFLPFSSFPFQPFFYLFFLFRPETQRTTRKKEGIKIQQSLFVSYKNEKLVSQKKSSFFIFWGGTVTNCWNCFFPWGLTVVILFPSQQTSFTTRYTVYRSKRKTGKGGKGGWVCNSPRYRKKEQKELFRSSYAGKFARPSIPKKIPKVHSLVFR